MNCEYHIGNTNYCINRMQIVSNIEIVEINDYGCKYHDFVILKYSYSKDVINEIKKLTQQYKKTERTVCLIGCKSKDQECNYRPSLNEPSNDISTLFDIFCSDITNHQYESLIKACYATRGGVTHGDPHDWLSLVDKRIGVNVDIISASNDNYQESFSSVLKQVKVGTNVHAAVVTLISCEKELSLNEMQDYTEQMKVYFTDNCNVSWYFLDSSIELTKIAKEVVLIYQTQEG